MRNEEVIEAPVDLKTITRRYTREAIDFITRNRHKPFFLYLPQATPGSERVPQVSDEFEGRSANGRYGDSIEELDWSTGQILATLKRLDIDDQTLVIFTSDNGAVKGHGGSNEPLNGWGYGTMEGGMRVPCVMRWPGHIPAGKICDKLTTTMDLLPTFARLAGTAPPNDRVIDGRDIWPLMACEEGAESPHGAFYYYHIDQLQAVRSGRWKLHLPLKVKRAFAREDRDGNPTMLFDLSSDLKESIDVSDKHPEVVERLMALAERARAELGDLDSEGEGLRPAGIVPNPTPRLIP